MEKRNIYIIIGVGAVLIVLIVLTILLDSEKQQTDQNIRTNQQIEQQIEQPSSQTTISEQLPSPSSGSTLEEAAKGFYDWYVSHPNPLGSGDYKKSPYLSVEFKETMSGFVARGDHLNNEPVLTCVGVKPPKNIISQREVYEVTQQKAYVLLQENVVEAKPLYKFIFNKVNQIWLIDDIRCVL